jgi:hypothetical protein
MVLDSCDTASVANSEVLESMFWDLGSSKGSKFTRIGAHFDPTHHHDLCVAEFDSKCWDLGLAKWWCSWNLVHLMLVFIGILGLHNICSP